MGTLGIEPGAADFEKRKHHLFAMPQWQLLSLDNNIFGKFKTQHQGPMSGTS